MLSSLSIQNFILIEHLTLDFKEGFTVITGETGAGKSILLGAIGLLMGQRADSASVRPGCEKCIIEAEFNATNDTIAQLLAEEDIEAEGGSLIIRREISAKGKSRAFLNDTPASLSLLKELSEQLIDIHSQHKNLLLGSAQFQLSILDLYSASDKLLADYTMHYHHYKQLERELGETREHLASSKHEQDYLEYQFRQLEEAMLREGELEQLEDEERQLSHALDIQAGLSRSLEALSIDEQGALSTLKVALDALHSIQRYYSEAEGLSERMASLRIELQDINHSLEQALDSLEYNPARLDEVSRRLDLLNGLLSKHGAQSIGELIGHRDSIGAQLEAINNSDSHLAELEQAVLEAHGKAKELAQSLHQVRLKAAHAIEAKVISSLHELGIPHVRFVIQLEQTEALSALGCSEATYLFSANKEIAPEPVAHIASGGEISRLMLSIKALIAGHRGLPSIIFDEIDTGVSGDVADKVGRILQTMGQSMQVMAVTHLPQIAASGAQHVYIYKEHGEHTTRSHIRYLSEGERIEEIARMQSGNNRTSVALAAARELLNHAQTRN